MFIGHYALALAAKRAAPGMSLGLAFAACEWLDLVWPVLVLVGIEKVQVQPGITAATPLDFVSYPWSHSLVMAVLWSGALLFLMLARRRPRRDALVGGLLVFSHWLLDFVSHRPDLPIVPGGMKVGLGLWNSVPATLVVELILFGVGAAIYVRTTQPRDGRGRWGLVALLGVLLVIYLANILGPSPPVGTPPAAIAGPALAMWLFVWWAGWIDRHRRLQPTGSGGRS